MKRQRPRKNKEQGTRSTGTRERGEEDGGRHDSREIELGEKHNDISCRCQSVLDTLELWACVVSQGRGGRAV